MEVQGNREWVRDPTIMGIESGYKVALTEGHRKR